MTRATIIKNGSYIRKVTVSGHALSNNHGMDVVCASVSILIQSIINGMIKVVGEDDKFYTINERKVTIIIKRPVTNDNIKQAQIDALLETLYINMEILYKQYKDFIDFCVKEEK